MIDVSIIIPTFNRAAVVRRAVMSCLTQSCAVEVIVVDDGSTDDTRAEIELHFGPGSEVNAARPQGNSSSPSVVRYIAQSNQGACAARNRGLSEATGAYVKFLDSDDELVAGALYEELCRARESNADVVVSAWEERTTVDGREVEKSRSVQPCPVLNQPIDDMLRGQSPWTAAALYRRAFVADLRWNTDIGQADDWCWTWTVCLAGAQYAMTDCVSAIYWHHDGERITSATTAVSDSVASRQRILRMVELSLEHMNVLTESRRQALSQYYYKDRLMVCENSGHAWRELWLHCRDLAPAFRPAEHNHMVKPFVSVLGVFWGVRCYVALRRLVRPQRSV